MIYLQLIHQTPNSESTNPEFIQGQATDMDWTLHHHGGHAWAS